jgi:16S rRNA G966 N2-methylase RsmD
MFPYKSTFITSTSNELFHNLCTDASLITPIRKAGFKYPIKMISEESCYDKANIITEFYTEKARMKAKLKGHDSPFEYWTKNEQKVREEARKRYGNEDNLSLREVIYFTCKEATAFSPVLSKCIYDNLLPITGGTVLDPFSGWGDRAIGAMASSRVKKYTGVDCNTDLYEGYNRLKKDLDKSDKVSFNLNTFEDFKCDELYDLVFTSPPHFDFEIYTDDSAQSITGREEYDVWMTEWMNPVLKKMSVLVRKGGIVALHIGGTYRSPKMQSDTVEYLTKICGMKFIQQIQCLVRGKKPVPVWVFHK